ncbi:MAG: hypothetical protein R2695_16575 [Acidimicrobiales bacterium]
MIDVEVRSGEAVLATRLWGEVPRVVALHPGIGDLRIWQWCAPMWADQGIGVAAYDRRGFGRTR